MAQKPAPPQEDHDLALLRNAGRWLAHEIAGAAGAALACVQMAAQNKKALADAEFAAAGLAARVRLWHILFAPPHADAAKLMPVLAELAKASGAAFSPPAQPAPPVMTNLLAALSLAVLASRPQALEVSVEEDAIIVRAVAPAARQRMQNLVSPAASDDALAVIIRLLAREARASITAQQEGEIFIVRARANF